MIHNNTAANNLQLLQLLSSIRISNDITNTNNQKLLPYLHPIIITFIDNHPVTIRF